MGEPQLPILDNSQFSDGRTSICGSFQKCGLPENMMKRFSSSWREIIALELRSSGCGRYRGAQFALGQARCRAALSGHHQTVRILLHDGQSWRAEQQSSKLQVGL